MNTEQRREFFVGLGLVGISALGTFVLIPTGIDLPASVEYRALSPDFWPNIVMVLLALSGGIVAIQAYVQGRGNSPKTETPADAPDGSGAVEHPTITALVRVACALAGMFLAYYLIPAIGIVASGMLLIFGATTALGERRYKYTIPLAVLVPLILYGFFVHVANIPLPLGLFDSLL